MSKKIYEAVTRGLARVKPGAAVPRVQMEQWERTCRSVADVLRENHPTYTFKTAKFLLACGIIEPQPVNED